MAVFDFGKEAFSLLEAQYISEKGNLIAKKTDKLSVLEIEPFTLNSILTEASLVIKECLAHKATLVSGFEL